MRRIEMSLLGALATAAIGITVFGPAAQAQQPAQCEPTVFLPEGGDKTVGKSDLSLDYDGRGNLTGTLSGSIPERKQTMPVCSFTYVAPGTFSAKLVGSYTPGPETFSAQAVEVQTTPGRATWGCPAAGDVVDQAFFTVYESPIFRNAFRDLRRQPDGSRASTGESTFSAGGGTCTTKYSLTLRQATPR